jgi:hypothetical protein
MQCIRRRYKEGCEGRFEAQPENEVLELEELQRNTAEK